MEKRWPLQQMLLGKLDFHMEKTETRSLSFTLYQIQLKVDQRPWYKAWYPETTPRNSRKYTETIGIGNDFLNRTQKIEHLRKTMNKWDCIKLKSFCTDKASHQTQETAHRMGEYLCQLLIWYPDSTENSKKTQPPKNQHPGEEMGTLIKQGILKGRGTNGQ
jgi:hypothetical protein